jgi:DNA-binding PadR family transcriptional regulator
LPKPQGTCGATKMKILAIIYQSNSAGHESYGYDIWKIMKEQFHTYLNDNDIGNVYHHLNDLCTLNYVARADEDGRCCYYKITEDGLAIKPKYDQYLDIMKSGN